MIDSLLITIVIEGVIVFVYALWKHKPVGRILFASILANILTQPMLWVVLDLFFVHYLTTLFISEIFIWLIESVILRFFPGTQLGWKESMLLSLAMNLSSFSVGWFFPV